ncbi:MAG: 50S ribosomal protein L10 [Synergistaceae bacterium]|nr:50S ribosomal protein L10 [Synergistota bacterium]NLM71991.1 50S ribosomal protein L10 [Synergistaceae bacterium]
MPSKQKFEMVDDFKERLSRAQAVFVCEFRGMNVAQITKLRSDVRAAGGEMRVAKNTLVRIAMEEQELPAFPDDIAFGPNIFALSYGDPVPVAKALKDIARARENKFFKIKGGILDNSLLSVDQIMALADLPSRDVLLGQVVRTIAAPIAGLLTVLSGPARGLVTCLDQIKEQKEKVA